MKKNTSIPLPFNFNQVFPEYLEENKLLAATHCEPIIAFQSGLTQLEILATSHLFSILQAAHLFQKDQDYNIEEIKNVLNMLPKYEQFLKAILELLCRQNFIVETAKDTFSSTNNLSSESHLKMQYQQIATQYPTITPNLEFLRNVLTNYLTLLSGKENILNIMFPDGSFHIVEQLYKKNPDAIYFNQFVSIIFEFLLKNKRHDLSIIEIGAGIGSTTEYLLPLLSNSQFNNQYLYTDVSKAFTRYGRLNFNKNNSFIDFCELDIDKDLEKQNIAQQSFDIIIATNVLHATKNISNTLDNINHLLKPGGFLIMNEGIQKRDFSTLIYGLIDGWWLFQDNELRIDNSPFLAFSTWKKLLIQKKFINIFSLNTILKQTFPIFQDIIVAQKNIEL